MGSNIVVLGTTMYSLTSTLLKLLDAMQISECLSYCPNIYPDLPFTEGMKFAKEISPLVNFHYTVLPKLKKAGKHCWEQQEQVCKNCLFRKMSINSEYNR